MTVVELPTFVRKAVELLTEVERERLIEFVAVNPDAGDVIPDSGGIRKLRWAAKGRGKSGGVRIIYYFHSELFPVFLLTVYAKNQSANLTGAERNELKKMIPRLISGPSKGRIK